MKTVTNLQRLAILEVAHREAAKEWPDLERIRRILIGEWDDEITAEIERLYVLVKPETPVEW